MEAKVAVPLLLSLCPSVPGPSQLDLDPVDVPRDILGLGFPSRACCRWQKLPALFPEASSCSFPGRFGSLGTLGIKNSRKNSTVGSWPGYGAGFSLEKGWERPLEVPQAVEGARGGGKLWGGCSCLFFFPASNSISSLLFLLPCFLKNIGSFSPVSGGVAKKKKKTPQTSKSTPNSHFSHLHPAWLVSSLSSSSLGMCWSNGSPPRRGWHPRGCVATSGDTIAVRSQFLGTPGCPLLPLRVCPGPGGAGTVI